MIYKPFFVLLALLIISCSSANKQIEIDNLIALHEDQRRAHIEGNASLLIAQMADSMITVQDGEVFISSKADIEERFAHYFSSVKYRKWDDIEPPRVEVSRDGTLAILVVRKTLELAPVVRDSIGTYNLSYWSWMSAYRKEKEEWKLYSIASGRNK